MAATNSVTHESFSKVDDLITKLKESANGMQDMQKHELATCHHFIEQLSEFEEDYKFWQVIQVLVIIVVVGWQIMTLRSYFYAKKLV